MAKLKRHYKETMKREDIPCPSVIKNYNSKMGLVDKSDMLVQLYKTPIKSNRWYLRIFAYCLEFSIVNAWLLYRRNCAFLGEKFMNLKMFRIEIYALASVSNSLYNKLLKNNLACQDVEIAHTSGQRHVPPDMSVRFKWTLFQCPVYTNSQTCKFCSTVPIVESIGHL